MKPFSVRLPFVGANKAREYGVEAALSTSQRVHPMLPRFPIGRAVNTSATPKPTTPPTKARTTKRHSAQSTRRRGRSRSKSITEDEEDNLVEVGTPMTTPSNNGSETKRERVEVPDTDSENEPAQLPKKRKRREIQTHSSIKSPKSTVDEDAAEEESTQLWEVERIVAAHIEAETYIHWYQVKWKGWSAKNNTWEPKKNLASCQDLIDNFEEAEAESAEKLKQLKKQNKKAAKP